MARDKTHDFSVILAPNGVANMQQMEQLLIRITKAIFPNRANTICWYLGKCIQTVATSFSFNNRIGVKTLTGARYMYLSLHFEIFLFICLLIYC